MFDRSSSRVCGWSIWRVRSVVGGQSDSEGVVGDKVRIQTKFATTMSKSEDETFLILNNDAEYIVMGVHRNCYGGMIQIFGYWM